MLRYSGGSRPGDLGGGSQILEGKKVVICVNTKGRLRNSLSVMQKRLLFVDQKVTVFVGRTMRFFNE